MGAHKDCPCRFDRYKAEKLTLGECPVDCMSSDSGGLMSSAGLVRYFDAEDQNTIRIDPRTIVAFGGLFGALILILNTVGGSGV